MNIFEQATRASLRFPSAKGELSVEQLWELQLTSRSGFDLDTVARAVNTLLRATSEESFVTTRVNPSKKGHELRLEILKHIIAVRVEEEDNRKTAALKAAKRAQLLELLAQKDEEDLRGKSREDLLAELNELSA